MCLSALNDENRIPKSGPVFDTSYEPRVSYEAPLMEKGGDKQQGARSMKRSMQSAIAPVQTQEREALPTPKSLDIEVDSLHNKMRLEVEQGSDKTSADTADTDDKACVHMSQSHAACMRKTACLDLSNDELTLEEEVFEQNQKKMLATVQGLMDLVRIVRMKYMIEKSFLV